jgi:hypothetical protein
MTNLELYQLSFFANIDSEEIGENYSIGSLESRRIDLQTILKRVDIFSTLEFKKREDSQKVIMKYSCSTRVEISDLELKGTSYKEKKKALKSLVEQYIEIINKRIEWLNSEVVIPSK